MKQFIVDNVLPLASIVLMIVACVLVGNYVYDVATGEARESCSTFEEVGRSDAGLKVSKITVVECPTAR